MSPPSEPEECSRLVVPEVGIVPSLPDFVGQIARLSKRGIGQTLTSVTAPSIGRNTTSGGSRLSSATITAVLPAPPGRAPTSSELPRRITCRQVARQRQIHSTGFKQVDQRQQPSAALVAVSKRAKMACTRGSSPPWREPAGTITQLLAGTLVAIGRSRS